MDIGKKLKELRLQNDLTLGDLASRSELTKGFLSQVERNLTTPSIATLQDILEALGSNLSEFFREEEETQIVFQTQDFFVDERENYTVHWIVPNTQKNEMEPIMVELPQGGESFVMDPHSGEEFGYVMQGEITIHIGKQTYHAEAGESFYYTPAKKHYITSKSGAVILWVSSPPSF